VALAAAIIGWQTALYRLRQIDKRGEREGQQIYLKYLVDLKTRLDDQVKNGPKAQAGIANYELRYVNAELGKAKDRIDELSK